MPVVSFLGAMTANELSFAEKMIVTIVLCCITLVGIFGNLLICIIFSGRRRVKQMHLSTRYLIINLGCIDMIISMNNIIYLLNVNGIYVTSNSVVCQWSGLANIGLVLISIWLIVLISINRVCIVTNRARFFSKHKTLTYMAAVWLLSIVYGVAPILGWSKYHYQQSRLVCSIIFLESKSFSILYFILFEVLPGIVIMHCSVVIIKLKRRNLQRILSFDVSNRQRRIQQDTRQTMMLLVVIFAFVVCYVPNFVIKRALRRLLLPPIILALSTVFRLLNHSINPVIYGFLNRDFRKSFFAICKSIFTLEQSGSRV